MKNRMREICTSGSVRGGGGNVPTYSAQSMCRVAGPVEPFVAIGLQQAAEVLQVRLRMLRLAVLAVDVGGGRMARAVPWPGINRVAPEPSGLRPPSAGIEHR